MTDDFIEDILKIAWRCREKGRYLALAGDYGAERNRNYETAQAPAEVAMEIATWIEGIIAKHMIYNPLFAEHSASNRYVNTAIRREQLKEYHAARG